MMIIKSNDLDNNKYSISQATVEKIYKKEEKHIQRDEKKRKNKEKYLKTQE